MRHISSRAKGGCNINFWDRLCIAIYHLNGGHSDIAWGHFHLLKTKSMSVPNYTSLGLGLGLGSVAGLGLGLGYQIFSLAHAYLP